MSSASEGPSFERYVASLPGGLDAYPAAQAKGTLVRSVLEDQPDAVLAGLPPPLRRWVDDPPLDSDWVREAALCALVHAVAEARGWREHAIVEWARERNRELFSGPLYRLLMVVATPEALLRHAGMRWSNFHRGSTLTFQGFADDGARLGLAFPVGLFDPLILRMHGAVIGVALELAHARSPVVAIEEVGDGVARYCARW